MSEFQVFGQIIETVKPEVSNRPPSRLVLTAGVTAGVNCHVSVVVDLRPLQEQKELS